jgi:hypothetical protein
MAAQITGNSTAASVAPVKLRAGISTVIPIVGLTRVYPVADVAYILLATSAYLDTTGRFKYITDIFSVADLAALNTSKIADPDAFSLTDSQVFSTDKGLSDSTTILDSVVTVLIFIRNFDETVSLADSKSLLVSPAYSDAFTTSDTTTNLVSKALSDAFGLNDLADVGDGIAFQFDDYTNNIVTISDGTVVATSPAYSDSVSFADGTVFSVSQSQADSISEVDSLAISFSGAYTDSATLVDNPAISFSTAFADSFGQSDAIQLNPALAKADSFSFTEAGVILIQNYADPTYFLEDYVGALYTF